MEKKRTSKATSNLKSATTKAKATVKSTVEKIEKTPAAEKTVKAVKKATETVAASHLKFLRHPSQLQTLKQLLRKMQRRKALRAKSSTSM